MATARHENTFGHALKEIQQASKESAADLVEQAQETVQAAVTEVDRVVHAKPWGFIGGAAAAAALLGFMAGRKSKS